MLSGHEVFTPIFLQFLQKTSLAKYDLTLYVSSVPVSTKVSIIYKYMSHFAYVCKMQYPLNLVLESWEYLWFY